MNSEEANIADYDDLTVTDEDYNEEERIKYAQFLEKRRERKEKGWEDPERWRSREYEDDPYLAQMEELDND